jgi:hypothetical protein
MLLSWQTQRVQSLLIPHNINSPRLFLSIPLGLPQSHPQTIMDPHELFQYTSGRWMQDQTELSTVTNMLNILK